MITNYKLLSDPAVGPKQLTISARRGRFYCKGYSELTLTYTRIKNALRKFVFARIDVSKFEDLNCFAPCDRSPNLSATNFPPNFGQICTARYPMISEWPQKNVGCRICRNCTTSEGNLCQREEPYFFASQKINGLRKPRCLLWPVC